VVPEDRRTRAPAEQAVPVVHRVEAVEEEERVRQLAVREVLAAAAKSSSSPGSSDLFGLVIAALDF